MSTDDLIRDPKVLRHVRAAAAELAERLMREPLATESLSPFARSLLLTGGERGKLNLAEREAAKLRREQRDAERARRRANAQPQPTVTLHAGRLMGLD